MLLGLGAFLALALGSGLDRLSLHMPTVARFVPDPLAAEAHRAIASQALRDLDGAPAVQAARKAVAADPADPRSAALLGAANLQSARFSDADRAFRVAARLGWRDPLTQLYFMNRALRGGDFALAALRLDAVLRQDPQFPARDIVLAQFAASGQGRKALAHRLSLRPSWVGQFMGSDSRLGLSELRKRAEIVAAVPGEHWGCDAVAPLVNRMINGGDARAAKRLWTVHCPDASHTIADPDFSRLRQNRTLTPFDWNPVGGGDVALAVTGTGGGMVVRVSGAASRMIAWQMLTLPPGAYLLRWTAQSRDLGEAQALSLSLACRPGERSPLRAHQSAEGQFAAEFQVAANCPEQYLSLWLAPAQTDVRIERIELAPYAKRHSPV